MSKKKAAETTSGQPSETPPRAGQRAKPMIVSSRTLGETLQRALEKAKQKKSDLAAANARRRASDKAAVRLIIA